MSNCTFMRKPKVKHPTKAEAYEHLNSPGNSGIHKRQVYRCSRCRYWHIGRMPTPKRFKHKPVDEILVGKLIGVLRGTYKGSDLASLGKEPK